MEPRLLLLIVSWFQLAAAGQYHAVTPSEVATRFAKSKLARDFVAAREISSLANGVEARVKHDEEEAQEEEEEEQQQQQQQQQQQKATPRAAAVNHGGRSAKNFLHEEAAEAHEAELIAQEQEDQASEMAAVDMAVIHDLTVRDGAAVVEAVSEHGGMTGERAVAARDEIARQGVARAAAQQKKLQGLLQRSRTEARLGHTAAAEQLEAQASAQEARMAAMVEADLQEAGAQGGGTSDVGYGTDKSLLVAAGVALLLLCVITAVRKQQEAALDEWSTPVVASSIEIEMSAAPAGPPRIVRQFN